MFRPYHQSQTFLFPPVLEELIPTHHPAHIMNDLVEKLDLTILLNRYGDMGQPAYLPKLMLKIILYGFSTGLFSARKLTRACEENLAFKYLAGLETPAFKTFIEFRKRHKEDMKDVFLQTVKLAQELGMKTLGSVALDGTKLEANTSKHKAMSYGRMQEEEKRLKEEIEALLKAADEIDSCEDQEYGTENDGYSLSAELARREDRLKRIEEAKATLEAREKKESPGQPIEDKKQISFADKEARIFTKKGQGTKYVYNAQATVDMNSQVIVENHIEDSVSDAQAAPTSLDNMEQGLGETPKELVADSAYGNQTTVEACHDKKVTPVCTVTREEKSAKEKSTTNGITTFDYDEKNNVFQCPHGLRFQFDHWIKSGARALYRCGEDSSCSCGKSLPKKGGATVYVTAGHLAQRELQRILAENQELYRRRKCTIEPVFGQIKSGMGFRRCLYRGLGKVGSEWNVVCAAFNLKKIAALIKAGVFTKPDPTGFSRLIQPGKALRSHFSIGLDAYMHLFKLLVTPINFHAAPLASWG